MTEYQLSGQNWEQWEVEAAVADYLEMFLSELSGRPINKAQHNRQLREILTARSRGSVEMKHQNISAVMIDLGLPYIDGYKPRFNYQGILFDIVANAVNRQPIITAQVEAEIQSQPVAPSIDDILQSLVDPPEPIERKAASKVRERFTPRMPRINYLLLDAQNSALGHAGEQFVVNFERARLIAAGKAHLADRVEQISRTQGDGAGFDVLSFETSATDRYIEVKTTKFGAYTPFFVSPNELLRSQHDADRYHIYRVYGFREHPRLYTVSGAFDKSFALETSQYVAKVSGAI